MNYGTTAELVSSRLLECEIWNRIKRAPPAEFARRCEGAQYLIGRVAMIEMVGPVLTTRDATISRCRADIGRDSPRGVGSLSAAQKQDVLLASYDDRLLAAARLLGIGEWTRR